MRSFKTKRLFIFQCFFHNLFDNKRKSFFQFQKTLFQNMIAQVSKYHSDWQP